MGRQKRLDMHRGERMSEVIGDHFFQDCVIDLGGDIYEDGTHFAMHKPLDTGRLVYAKLCMAFKADIEIEVWFDHFDNTITAQLRRGDDLREVTFYDQSMARVMKLEYVDRLVYEAQGAFN